MVLSFTVINSGIEFHSSVLKISSHSKCKLRGIPLKTPTSTTPCNITFSPKTISLNILNSPLTTGSSNNNNDDDDDNNNNGKKQQLTLKRLQVMEKLRRDLLMQYEAPRSLDWDLYDDKITFDDPMTKLSNKLQYRGMLLTIGLLVIPLFFQRNKTSFILHECELVAQGEKIRTKFETKGVTKWGAMLTITGTDYFWFGTNSAKIVRHESTWDQTADQITNDFFGIAK